MRLSGNAILKISHKAVPSHIGDHFSTLLFLLPGFHLWWGRGGGKKINPLPILVLQYFTSAALLLKNFSKK